MNKNVAILFNKPEPLTDMVREEHLAAEEVLDAVEAVEQSLKELNYVSQRLPLDDDVGDLLMRLREFKPDLVFNLVESFREESLPQMNIPALLDVLGLRYIGSGPRALGLTTDKALAKA